MVAPSVYRASHVCGNVCTVAALCCRVGDSTASENGDECLSKAGWSQTDCRDYCECVQPAQTPCLIPTGSSSVPQGTTSKICSPPGQRRTQQKRGVGKFLQGHTREWTWGRLSLLTEMSTLNISWGKDGRCVGLTTLPPSCADYLELWEPQPPGTIRACQGL
jgi:hypothetical protein